jgi:hypothetical protein
MKSILQGPKKSEPSRPKYPYLGIFPHGEVVLFTDTNTGFSVHHPVKDNRYHMNTKWVEKIAVPLKGKIILSND